MKQLDDLAAKTGIGQVFLAIQLLSVQASQVGAFMLKFSDLISNKGFEQSLSEFEAGVQTMLLEATVKAETLQVLRQTQATLKALQQIKITPELAVAFENFLKLHSQNLKNLSKEAR